MESLEMLEIAKASIAGVEGPNNGLQFGETGKVEGWALGMDADIAKVLQSVEALNAAEVDVPEPDHTEPGKLSQEVEVGFGKTEAGKPKHTMVRPGAGLS
jgi:hypothetical protein